MRHNEKQALYDWYGEHLLAWYFNIERDLPWRKNHDPYRIWVSEIMLQQTQVNTVIPYFERFMDNFPTVEALAQAPEEEVLKCWEGLGYYSRARNLQAGAKIVVEQYDGIIPNDMAKVAKIKGVGPYTTGAIMSIAFNEPISAVDGNVMRVLSRFLCLHDDIAKVSTRKNIEIIATEMIPPNQARYFNQALMELGALVCTPKSPSCETCPVAEKCEARIQGLQKELPVKTKAKKARVEYRVALIIARETEQGKAIFIRQRPSDGLLASMWELPHIQVATEDEVKLQSELFIEDESLITPILKDVYEAHHLLARPKGWFADKEHIFSHIHWKMRIYEADLDELLTKQDDDHLRFIAEHATSYYINEKESNENKQTDTVKSINDGIYITKEDMSKYPFPNLFLKIIEQFFTERG